MVRVFGVDPGIGRTGFGVIDVDERQCPHLVDTGCIATQPNSEVSGRLLQLSEDIRSLFELHSPDVLAIEELYFAKNVTTGLTVAQARGVILLEAARLHIPIAHYAPSQVKQTVTSSGSAPKRQVQEMVKLLLRLQEVPQPDDAADALAVALCHTSFKQVSNIH